MITIWMWVSIAGATITWIFVGIIYWQIRQWRQLNDMLFYIVVKSFTLQHLPIWHAWSAMSGLHFRIDLEDRRKS